MALTVDVNAYSDVDDADTYFEDHINASDWTSATEENKEKALVTATRIFDRLPLLGQKTDSDQDLQFPRTGLTYLDGTAVDSASVPQLVIETIYELAKYLLSDPASANTFGETGNIKSVKAGPVTVEFLGSGRTLSLPENIYKMVDVFLATRASSSLSGITWIAEYDKSYLGDTTKYRITSED